MGGLGKRHECHKHRVATTTVSGSGQSRETVDDYDDDGQLIEEQVDSGTGSGDEVTKYQYDLDGNQTEASQLVGDNVWATTDTYYNAEGQPWEVVGPAEPDGVRPETITLYDLDGESCETQVENLNAQGSVYWAVSDTTFDADGNAYETQGPPDAAGARPMTFSFYNNQGELRFSQTPLDASDGKFSQFQYDSLGEQVDAVGPTGVETKTAYDDAGDAVESDVLRALSGGGTAATVTVYDNEGDATSTTDPDQTQTTCQYDVSGDVTQETVGDETTHNSYDSFGNQTSSTDPKGELTSYTVDAFGEPTAETLPAVTDGGQPVQTVYNDLGQVVSTTDSDGNQTSYQYDDLGRCIKMTDPDGTTTYGYDLEGDQTSVQDPDGNTTSYTYLCPGQVAGGGFVRPVCRWASQGTGQFNFAHRSMAA